MTWVFWTLLVLLLGGVTVLSILARRGPSRGRRRIVSGRYGFWRSLKTSVSYMFWAMSPRWRRWDAPPPDDPSRDYAEDWDPDRERRRRR